MLQASLFMISYDQPFLISPFNVRLMIQRSRTICIILNKTVWLKRLRQGYQFKKQNPFNLVRIIWIPNMLVPRFVVKNVIFGLLNCLLLSFFATDDKDGHGLAMDAK